MNVNQICEATQLIPVVVIEDAADAVPTAKAMLKGGIGIMEITFRTAAAKDAIIAVSKECREMVVGAGTIITLEQCRAAVEAGAQFIVSPGFNEQVVAWCVENHVAVFPGCVTPTEIMQAMKYGLGIIKFFPAGIYGGISAMKALSGPFPQLKFIPTGGINAENLGDFIKEKFVYAVGGSWMCKKSDIVSHQFQKITELCREAGAIVAESRGRNTL